VGDLWCALIRKTGVSQTARITLSALHGILEEERLMVEKRNVPMIPETYRSFTTGSGLRAIGPSPLEEAIKNIDEWREAYPELVDTPMGRVLAQKREAAATALASAGAQACPTNPTSPTSPTSTTP
jgi:hypothetical protein